MSHTHSTARDSESPSARSETASLPSWTASEVLAAGLGFGLVAGVVEAVAAGIRWKLMHVTVYMGAEAVWLLPLTDGFIFAVLGLALAALGARWRALRTPRVVLAWFAGLLILAAAMLTEKIHIAAELILAAGLGVGVARVLAPRADAIRRGLRLGVPAGLALVLLIGVGQWRLRAGAEGRDLVGSPGTGPRRPNILLLVLDTVRAWNLGLYGYGRHTTPLLQQWAAKGTLFQRTLAPAPWTTLSHASMFTGRFPPELSVTWQRRYDGAYPTLADLLRQAGYATAGFAGNYLNLGRGTGLAQGFAHYEDYPFEPIQLLRSTSLCFRLLRMDRVKQLLGRRRNIPALPAIEVNGRFLRWLDGHEDRPWFAFLNYFEAHGPYLPPVPWDTIYMGRADPPVDRYWANLRQAYGPPLVPLQELAEAMDAYDGAIAYLDRQVDSLLRALDARGQLENTIVVVTSDHGELFGEHGVVTHGNNLYLPVLHVPLLIVAPGRVPAGATVPSLASLRDLPATLLELAGVPARDMPGHSLVPLFRPGGAALVTDTLFASLDFNSLLPAFPPSPVLRGPMQTVVLDSLQYIRNGDGVEELYHLGHDAWQVHNLVAEPAYQAALAAYRGAARVISSEPGEFPQKSSRGR
jgi:arylsulfatase A-like enzyme